MNNSSRGQPRGFKGRYKLSQPNQATGGVNMFHTLSEQGTDLLREAISARQEPKDLKTWPSFGSPINSFLQEQTPLNPKNLTWFEAVTPICSSNRSTSVYCGF